ncbi:MAG: DUF2878 domain-containing protein [Marinobacter sp.]|uniref:DUF2878 domain-containing protein n=1 Tax=Marinobacter sp. TaxID=50741 RepID=UPI00299E73BA|nr:DUF2878 domain-containing protein [Marinobacter sp.]MDX1755012.1 DUF2878 domain-containing protein [Marinobacter sp.]
MAIMRPASTLSLVLNFAAFQLGWLVCVLFTNQLAAVAALLLVLAHLRWLSVFPGPEALFILLGTASGALLDSLWLGTGVLVTTPDSVLAPLWLVALWALFMTTLCHSLAWLGRRRVLPFLLAPIAGPCAYWAASGLGAVQLGDRVITTLLLAAGWLVLFPGLLTIRKRFFPGLV